MGKDGICDKNAGAFIERDVILSYNREVLHVSERLGKDGEV